MYDPSSRLSVSPLEEIVINLIPVPEHPGTVFDGDAFRSALARSVSLRPDEKVAILRAVPELSQEQVDALFAILAAEAATFGRLAMRLEARVADEEVAQRRRASFRLVPGGRS